MISTQFKVLMADYTNVFFSLLN